MHARFDEAIVMLIATQSVDARAQGPAFFWNTGNEAMVTWTDTATVATEELQCKVRQ